MADEAGGLVGEGELESLDEGLVFSDVICGGAEKFVEGVDDLVGFVFQDAAGGGGAGVIAGASVCVEVESGHVIYFK